MPSTSVFILVAALFLTNLAATPGDAYPFGRFRIPARFRGRGGWLRGRYSPPATAPPTTPAPCTCAPPSAPAAGTGAGGARSGAAAAAANVPEPDSFDIDCVTPLAGVMYCGEFLTGRTADAPAPTSDCCAGLARFFYDATVAGGGGDSQLKCICPVIRGDVNEFVVKPLRPVDPLRMMYLPYACGVAVPPKVIPLCLNASSLFVTAPA